MSRSAPADTLPSTARSIALLLASTPTVQDAQPGVLHQLLEFSYRYTSQVLSDALVYSDHAGRSGKVEMDDVTLAIQARVGWEFGGRIPKEVNSLSLLVIVQFQFYRMYSFTPIVHTLVGGTNKCDTTSRCARSIWRSITPSL